MKKNNSLILALTVLVIASLACGVNFNTGTDPQAVTDVCLNIEGAQSTVPSGYQVDVAGNCNVPAPVPPVQTDVCKNIEGVQPTVPFEYGIDPVGNCIPIPREPFNPPATDVCKNIEGAQSTVPSGMEADTAGNCNVIPPPAPKNPIATANYQLDCNPYPSKRTNIWIDGVEKGKTMEIIGKNTELGLWYQVKWKANICWVDSVFVTVSGDTSAVPYVPVDIHKEDDDSFMRITITNNTDKNLCRMELHAVGGGLLWWYEPGKGNWDSGDTATLDFNLKKGNYDVYIYTCKGDLVDYTPNFYIEDGGDYTTP